MAGQDNRIEMEARLAKEGELRFTPAGHAVCNASVGYTPRFLNKTTDKWEDGETSWFDIEAWRKTGEMLAEIPKGTLIQIFGSMRKHYWKGHEGERREKTIITVDRFCIPVFSDKGFTVDDDRNIVFHRFQGKRVKEDAVYADGEEPFVMNTFEGEDFFAPGTRKYRND